MGRNSRRAIVDDSQSEEVLLSSAKYSDNSEEQKKENVQAQSFGFQRRNQNSELNSAEELGVTRSKRKRNYLDRDENPEDSDEFNTDFTIMAFTAKKRKVGNTLKYTIIDHEQREHEVTMYEIEAVSKKDSDMWELFMKWIGGKENYKQLFNKSLPKVKPINEPLPAKRQRKERQYSPEAGSYNSSNYQNSDDEQQQSKRNVKKITKKNIKVQKTNAKDSGKTELDQHPEQPIQQQFGVEGNLDENIPMRVRSLHGIQKSKEYPETICTIEWKRDIEKGTIPRDSSVTYAEMRRQYPLLLCDFFAERTKFVLK